MTPTHDLDFASGQMKENPLNVCDPKDVHQFIDAVFHNSPSERDLEWFANLVKRCEEKDGSPPISISQITTESHTIRTARIPKGTVLCGLKHKTDHVCICIGDMTVMSQGNVTRYKSVNMILAKAGTMRIGFAHSDVEWVNIHIGKFSDLTANQVVQKLVYGSEKLKG